MLLKPNCANTLFFFLFFFSFDVHCERHPISSCCHLCVVDWRLPWSERFLRAGEQAGEDTIGTLAGDRTARLRCVREQVCCATDSPAGAKSHLIGEKQLVLPKSLERGA